MFSFSIHRSLVPLQDEPTGGDYVVLPARDSSDVVGWRPGVEVASFASKSNKSPDANIDAGAKIKHPASELARD